MSYIGKIIRYIIPSSEKVFEYTGEGCVVQKDVTIVRFHPTVTEIGNYAFRGCNNLREVVFNDRGYKRLERRHFVNAHHYQASRFHLLLLRLEIMH